MWRLVFLLIFLSLATSVWMAYELGIIYPQDVMASDKAVEKTGSSLDSLERSLQEREKNLQLRETALSRRERSLEDKEKILNQQMERYEKSIKELREKVVELETLKQNHVDSFRQVYERMEPKKASKILDEMEIGLASQILGGMRGEKAAEILGRMSPARARLITEKYVGRRIPASQKVNEVNPNQSSQGVGSPPAETSQ